MTIGEARKIYSGQIHEFWNQKLSLAKQKKELEAKANAAGTEKGRYSEQTATLELSYQAVTEKYDEYHDFMQQLTELHSAYFNEEASRQQADAMEEYTKDLGKIMETARRIAHGDKVPMSDEKKLMEFNMEMYMAAKNMASINQSQKQKEYDSLWKEEEGPAENPDPFEYANGKEMSLEAPEVVNVQDVVASATAGPDLSTTES